LLKEIAAETDLDKVKAATGAPLIVSDTLKTFR
jgi:acyl CoA:acetate/3-ketoacid CoA transferase beta subunit